MRNLREIVTLDGSSNLVYLDESGFEEYVYRQRWLVGTRTKNERAIAMVKEEAEQV